ncbi:hypothetical protein BGZ54_009414 [Gamsiella multidivaricata]|nr:hypothetical protein BGZ54_009414 [Gamsiella multidivaricata]
MKITIVSAVLCLATAAAAANVDRSSYGHPSMNGLDKRDGTKAAKRHEDHHVEPAKDNSSNHDHGNGHDDKKDKSDNKNNQVNKKESGANKDTKDGKGGKDDKGGKGDKGGNDNKNDGIDNKDGGKDASEENDNTSAAIGDKDGDKDASEEDDNALAAIGDNDGDKGASEKDDNAPAIGDKDGDEAPANGGDDKIEAAPALNADDGIPRDYTSPLWVVQPYGASVWEQNRAYVITWGPNPDPIYAKNIKPKSPVSIRLMQGPPKMLREVSVLANNVDESLHSFEWMVPTSVEPAKDYTIRVTHEGEIDTYSHYFEVAKAGDPRSSKSNVGEPIKLPQKGDQLDKEGDTKPDAPSNSSPEESTANDAPPNSSSEESTISASHVIGGAAAMHASAASETLSANMLAFAMTLFGAVYFL